MSHFVRNLNNSMEKEKYYNYLYDNIFQNRIDSPDNVNVILFRYVDCDKDHLTINYNKLIQTLNNHKNQIISIIYYGNGYTVAIPPIMLNNDNYNMILDYLEIYNTYNHPYYMETINISNVMDNLFSNSQDTIKIIHSY